MTFDNYKKYYITEDPRLMQDKIRKHGAENLPKFLFGMFILLLIENWFPDLLSLAFPTTVADIISKTNPSLSAEVINQLPRIPILLYVYGILFNAVIKLGEALYCLTYIRNRQVDVRALYEGFTLYFKALLLYIIEILLVSFWSMFFVIPGIVAALNYSQIFYILADDPDKELLYILNESKYRMLGNRIAYIKMLVSYIPYILLSLLPSIVVQYFFTIDTTTMVGLGLELVTDSFLYIALGYLSLGKCVFYELLINSGYNNFKYRNQDAFRENNEATT